MPWNNAKKWKGGQKASATRTRKRNREFIVRAKSKPCVDCKIQYNPWVMQFDHREPAVKKFEMSNLRRSYSLKTVEYEISKCDVVCANCHAERTYKQQLWKIPRGTFQSEFDVDSFFDAGVQEIISWKR